MTKRQALRRLGWAWCALASGIATISAIIGVLERENDRT